ncbi:MAG: Uma2 family endonuclease [Planctomycetes bacterium]|nr:Uma2 family endonuclease [Planctomycetota bacterium]
MKLTDATIEVEYPESDGLPMGETDLHRWWMIHLTDVLERRYHDRRVYVSSNLLLYYEEGEPLKFVSPDVFVVKDCEPRMRRVFKTWEEGRVPQAVFEVTSASTRREDAVFKPEKYAHIQVAEYFLYDPTADYLKPPLRGYRLQADEYCAIEPDATGALVSEELDLLLRLEGRDLALFDRHTGERQLSTQEALEAERAAREVAEAENTRLRQLLKDRDGA